MRNIDERCAAVRNRERRLQRRRSKSALVVILCLALIPLVDLAGRSASGTGVLPFSPIGELFGTSSLLGPSAGGYVLVAVAAAAIAVVVTALLMARRHASGKSDAQPDDSRAINREASETDTAETEEGSLNG